MKEEEVWKKTEAFPVPDKSLAQQASRKRVAWGPFGTRRAFEDTQEFLLETPPPEQVPQPTTKEEKAPSTSRNAPAWPPPLTPEGLAGAGCDFALFGVGPDLEDSAIVVPAAKNTGFRVGEILPGSDGRKNMDLQVINHVIWLDKASAVIYMRDLSGAPSSIWFARAVEDPSKWRPVEVEKPLPLEFQS